MQLCCVCCGCCTSQERINRSAVPRLPTFSSSLSSHLAYHGFSKQCAQWETARQLALWAGWRTIHCKRQGFDTWVGIPWRRKWQPNTSILAWWTPRTEDPGGWQFIRSQSRTWLKQLSSSMAAWMKNVKFKRWRDLSKVAHLIGRLGPHYCLISSAAFFKSHLNVILFKCFHLDSGKYWHSFQWDSRTLLTCHSKRFSPYIFNFCSLILSERKELLVK